MLSAFFPELGQGASFLESGILGFSPLIYNGDNLSVNILSHYSKTFCSENRNAVYIYAFHDTMKVIYF